MYRNHFVSVIVPCLNEEDALPFVLGKLPSFVDECIVVDNGSTDRSVEVAKNFGVTVVSEPNKGYGSAYKKGLSTVKDGIIICLDGDATYPIDSMAPMIDILLDQDVAFVSGQRILDRGSMSMSIIRQIGNCILSVTARILFHVKLKDSQSGMWVFRRNLLDHIIPQSNNMSFSQEFKLRVIHSGLSLIELPIEYGTRKGESELSIFKDGIGNLLALFRLAVELKKQT
jgi:dolichol-phosphate hexosyltransferase